jgi:hypothetical protein
LKEEGKKEEEAKEKDLNDFLSEPLKVIVRKAWDESYIDPTAEAYKKYSYINLSSLGYSLLRIIYKPSEGRFTHILDREKPTEVDIGLSATTFAGVKGTSTESYTVTIERDFLTLDQERGILNALSNLYTKAKANGLREFKYYLKHPEKTPPEVFTRGTSYTTRKYFEIVKDPRKETSELKRKIRDISDKWERVIGRDYISDLTISVMNREEYGIAIVKTKDVEIVGTQKENRLTVEGMLNLKEVGETLEAIGCTGGLEGLQFTHPYTLKKTRGLDAIDALGDWLSEKGQKLLRKENPDELFPEKTVNVIMPSTPLILAMSYFFMGKRMWEEIESGKDLNRLVGQRVAPSEISLIVDGRQRTSWDENLYGTLEMDSEGTLAREKTIVDRGRLVRFFNSRLYFLPVAEKTVLKDELLKEEDPLTATARKATAGRLHDTIPTNLYVKSETSLTLDELINKLPKEKNSLYVASVSIGKVDLDKRNIALRIDMGSPIMGGKINTDVTVGKIILNINFNNIVEKMAYIGGPDTQVTHSFNMEYEGKIYETSVTGPYVALLEVDKGYSYYSEDSFVENLFTSDQLWSEALPIYLMEKLKYLHAEEYSIPERIKNIGVIYPPTWLPLLYPQFYIRQSLIR